MSIAMASPPRAICEASLAVLSPGMLSRIVRWQKCLEPTCPYCMETCGREDNSLVRHIADAHFWTVDEELENHRPEALETASEGRGGKEDGKPDCWLHGGTVAEHEGSLREKVGSRDGDTAEKKPTSSSLPEQLVVGGFVREGSVILSQAGTVFYSFEESQDTSAAFAGTRLEENVGKVVKEDLDEGVEEDMAEVEEKGEGQFFGGGEDEILREDRDALLEDRRDDERDGILVEDEGEISGEHRDEVAEENRVEAMVESEVMDGKQDLVLEVMDEKQGAVLEEKRDVISEKKLEELSERDPDELFEEKRDEALDEKKEGIAWGASSESLDGKLEREAKTLEVEFAVSRVVEAIVNWKGKVIDDIFEDNDGVFAQFTPVDGGREQISEVTPAKASSDDVDGILLESREELDEDEFSKHSLKRRKEVDRAETAVDSNEEKPEEGHRKADEACDMDVAENVDVDKAFGLTYKVASPLVVTLDESSSADSSVLFDGDDDCGDRGNGDAGVEVEAERTPTPDERARVEDFRGGGDLKTNEVDDEDYVRSPPKRARLTDSASGSPGAPGHRGENEGARVVVEQSSEEELDSRLLRMRRFLRRVADARDPLSAGLTPFPDVVGKRRRVTFAPVTNVHAVYATRRLRPVPCGRCGLIVCDGLLGLRLHVREHARNLSCVLCGVAGFGSFADLRRHSCPGWSAGGDEGVSPEDVKDAEDMIIAEIVDSGSRTIRV